MTPAILMLLWVARGGFPIIEFKTMASCEAAVPVVIAAYRDMGAQATATCVEVER